ncbi:hypothetical protein B7494_g173 [Chlorociboria aeruginascens]|nr:hypothetical protein B7494_g173 [Chlorociboria aeruginascens]
MATDPEKAEVEKQDIEELIQERDTPIYRDNTSNSDPEKEERKRDSTHSHSSTLNSMTPGPIDPQRPTRSKSKSSSTRSRQITVIPRPQRRGLLARFSLIPEISRPYDYKRSTKWLITLQVALAAAAAPMGSSIFYPALTQLTQDLNTTSTTANLSVALYMLSMSIFPLWWSSFSETLGRRTIYLISFLLFTLFNIISALSVTITMLIIMRILGGGAAASVQAVGAGTIADIWEVKERGRAMGIFYLGPLLGPLLAPIIGGVLSQAWGWRSTQWFQTIYGGILFIILTFCLPETLARKASHEIVVPAPHDTNTGNEIKTETILTRISTRQSVQMKTKRAAAIFKRCFIDPLSVLAYLRFPAVFLTVYVASIAFGSLYVLNISVQQTFSQPPYNYSVIIIGLLYLPNSVGYMISSIFGGRWTDKVMHREAYAAGRIDENGKPIFLPEDRMRENAWTAALIFPGALLWYGWTAQYDKPLALPMIANFFFGLGSMLIFGLCTTMLTEFMTKRSSSGVAVNNFVRNIFSCVGGVVAQPIISAIGNGWLFTILAIVCWISAFGVIWAVRKFGPRWRLEMDAKLNK